jgi:NADH-quinone oxidoreductase subunit H
VISYEIALGLSIVGVILYAGSLSTADIVASQSSGWYLLLLAPSFVVFVIAMVGETNRAPFDLPEAESELVGGFHTEYSSLKFALFFLAEYVNMVTVSAMATTLFLGGGQWPWPLSFLNANGWLQFIAFLIKMFIFLFIFIWLRGTLPRLRYDQFMRLGWKVLVPLNLVWIVMVTFAKVITWNTASIIIAAVAIFIVVALFFYVRASGREEESESVPVTGGGFPVPPLDLKVPQTTPRQKALAKAEAKAARRKPAAVGTAQEGAQDGVS